MLKNRVLNEGVVDSVRVVSFMHASRAVSQHHLIVSASQTYTDGAFFHTKVSQYGTHCLWMSSYLTILYLPFGCSCSILIDGAYIVHVCKQCQVVCII